MGAVKKDNKAKKVPMWRRRGAACPFPRVPVDDPRAVLSPWRAASYELEQQNFFNFITAAHLERRHFLRRVRDTVQRDATRRKRRPVRTVAGGWLPVSTIQSSESALQVAAAEASRVLLDVSGQLVRTGFAGKLKLSWPDVELVAWCEGAASACKALKIDRWPSGGAMDDIVAEFKLGSMLRAYGFPVAIRRDLFGSLMPTILRFFDAKFWRRQARRVQARVIDQIAREARIVRADRDSYCSAETVRIRRSQRRRNRGILERLEAVNQDGDSYSLAELADLSPSNPFVRRSELMVRIRGFEEYADYQGHGGWFITLTAPSRFHTSVQVRNKSGKIVRVVNNKNFDGSTPRDAQAWLCSAWARIRAKLARIDLPVYGFRVAEPHADGCPHWHFLLFSDSARRRDLAKVFYDEALKSECERGAQKYRVKFVVIDKSRGSAAGYIAKYISKNIDGAHIDSDLFGNAGHDAAEAIGAWSGAWGIRQFQQIGGASVTVWRELRRLEPLNVSPGIEWMRQAAAASDWCAYLIAMGGAVLRRDDRPVAPAYWHEIDAGTGEVLDKFVDEYGEPNKGKLFGVLLKKCREYFISRVHRWTLRDAGRVAVESAVDFARTIKRAGARVLGSDDELDFMRSLSEGLSLDDLPNWG